MVLELRENILQSSDSCPRAMDWTPQWPYPAMPEVQELAESRWFVQTLPHYYVHICCDNHCPHRRSKDALVKEG